MIRAVATLVLFSAALVSGANIKWTGIIGNGLWDTADNWYPARVPGAQDDVSISHGTVTITTPTTVNMIQLGTETQHSPTLIVTSSVLVITNITVFSRGTLGLSSGVALVNGTVQLEGGLLAWYAGTLSGAVNAVENAIITLSTPAAKTLSSCELYATGSISANGVLILHQSSIRVSGTMTVSNDFSISSSGGSGPLALDMRNGTLVVTNGAVATVQASAKLGNVSLLQGGNISIYSQVEFLSAPHIPLGSSVTSNPTAEVSMLHGLTGSGDVYAAGKSLSLGQANFSGTIHAMAFDLTISEAAVIANLVVTGGNVITNAPLSVTYLQFLDGNLQGPSPLTAFSGVASAPGSNVASLVIAGDFIFGEGTFFGTGMPSLTINSGAKVSFSAVTQFIGEAGSEFGLMNYGVMEVNGTLGFHVMDLDGSGSVVISGSLEMYSNSVRQGLISLVGNGVFIGATAAITNISHIVASPAVVASINGWGGYPRARMTCRPSCRNVTTYWAMDLKRYHFAVAPS